MTRAIAIGVAIAQTALAQTNPACPADPNTWIPQLLNALPAYANRTIQRDRLTPRAPQTYILLTSTPEIDPIPPSPTPPTPPNPTQLHQIFFTTLERQYVGPSDGTATPQLIQQFHWLVLSQSSQGRRLIRLRSQFAPYPAEGQLLSPPRSAESGPIAEAIRLWLRDCDAKPVP